VWTAIRADVVLVFRRGLIEGGSQPAARQSDVCLEFTTGETLTSPLLPGFSLPVGEIFVA